MFGSKAEMLESGPTLMELADACTGVTHTEISAETPGRVISSSLVHTKSECRVGMVNASTLVCLPHLSTSAFIFPFSFLLTPLFLRRGF